METGKPGSAKVAFKWTLIYVVTSIVITYAMQFLNVSQTSPVKYLSYIPFIGFMFVAQKEYRDQLGGFMTFGEGFLAGFLYSVFSAIILAVFIYLYFAILSPQIWQQVLDAQRDALQGKDLPGDQVDQAMQLMQKFGILLAVAGILFVTPIFGAIISLIGAAIFKKERSIVDLERDAPGFTDPVS
jgi:hypothetical protein